MRSTARDVDTGLEPRPDRLAARLLATRTAQEAAGVIVEHLIQVRGYARVLVLPIDPNAGRLRGVCGQRFQGELRTEELVIDPVSDPGPISEALSAAGPIGPRMVGAGALPGPLDGATELLVAPLASRPTVTDPDPGECPRFDCPQRHGPADACGGGEVSGAPWTRDRLTCGLLPVAGVIGVAAGAGDPPLDAASADEIARLAVDLSALFGNFRLQEALHDAEYFREDIFDSMTEGIIATNLRGDVLLTNRAAEEITGVERHEALGRPVDEVLREIGQARSCAREALQQGRTFLREERIICTATGSELPVSVTTAPVTARGWGMRGVLISFVDLTPLKRMEHEIRRLDRLATIGRFTSAVAHEIRNPLGGILAGVQYLKGVLARDPDHARHVSFIESEVQRLNRIVEDLSSVSRKRPPRRVPCPLAEILQRVCCALAPMAEARGVSLEIEETAAAAMIDPDQMQQVVVNLVKNGIEACRRGGGVRVGARIARRSAAPVAVIEVADTGLGIAGPDLEHIFEPFYSTKREGTGLGLYVSHSIVDAHGGSIEVESSGEGTTFRVIVSAEVSSEARAA